MENYGMVGIVISIVVAIIVFKLVKKIAAKIALVAGILFILGSSTYIAGIWDNTARKLDLPNSRTIVVEGNSLYENVLAWFSDSDNQSFIKSQAYSFKTQYVDFIQLSEHQQLSYLKKFVSDVDLTQHINMLLSNPEISIGQIRQVISYFIKSSDFKNLDSQNKKLISGWNQFINS